MNSRFNAGDFPEHIFVHNLFGRQKIAVPSAVLINGKQLSVFLGCLDHFRKICAVHRDRLFADDVFPRRHRGERQGLMRIVRRRDDDKLDRGVREQRLIRLIKLYALFRSIFLTFFVDIGNADKLEVIRGQDMSCLPIALAAKSDYTNTMFHFDPPPGNAGEAKSPGHSI